MSSTNETTKQDIMVYRSGAYRKDNGRQSSDHQTDRITTFTASDICDGDLPGREKLRFHRKVYS